MFFETRMDLLASDSEFGTPSGRTLQRRFIREHLIGVSDILPDMNASLCRKVRAVHGRIKEVLHC